MSVAWILKGSVERVLARCTRALGATGTRSSSTRRSCRRQAEAFAARGLRVLAFAQKTLAPERAHLTHEDVAADMVFLGLQAHARSAAAGGDRRRARLPQRRYRA